METGPSLGLAQCTAMSGLREGHLSSFLTLGTSMKQVPPWGQEPCRTAAVNPGNRYAWWMSLGSSVGRRSPRVLPGHPDNEQHFLAPPRKLPETSTHPHPDCVLLGCAEGPSWLCDFGLLIAPF